MEEYSKVIENNACIVIKDIVPIIKAATKEHKAITGKPIIAFGLSCIFLVEPTIEIDKQGEITLTLKWKDNKEQKSQAITIKKEKSNMVSDSYIYYFFSGSYKCRKIFYIKKMFKSRKEFKHSYKIQGKNRKQRKEERLLRNPYRRYGKERYKGKLTPYGKRCLIYNTTRHKVVVKLYTEAAEAEKTTIKQLKEMLALVEKAKKKTI